MSLENFTQDVLTITIAMIRNEHTCNSGHYLQSINANVT